MLFFHSLLSMENITNQSSINQSNTNSVYSSVEVSKQQQVTVNIPNNNVIDVNTQVNERLR